MDRLSFNQQLADMARRIADDLTETNGHGPPGGSDRRTTLDEVVIGPVDLIKSCSLASVAVIRHGRKASTIDTLAASHDEARLVDHLQHDIGEGPLIELRRNDIVISGNVETDDRWPRWGALASDQHRIRSAMAFRLFTDDRSLAALSMYSEEPDAFTDDDVVDASLLRVQRALRWLPRWSWTTCTPPCAVATSSVKPLASCANGSH